MSIQHRASRAAAGARGRASPRSAPGRRTIISGIVVLAVGVAAMIAGIVAFGMPASVSQFQRVNVSDGHGTITFSRTGDYVAYYESSSITRLADQPESVTASRVPLVPVQLTSEATGQRLVLDTPYGNRSDHKPAKLHYDYQGRGALAMWQFHISHTGSYRAVLGTVTPAARDAVVAFGPPVASLGSQGLFLADGILILGGLVTLITGIVVRRRATRSPAHAA
jgi:hypothetical protein